jgi:hypothetical protein
VSQHFVGPRYVCPPHCCHFAAQVVAKRSAVGVDAAGSVVASEQSLDDSSGCVGLSALAVVFTTTVALVILAGARVVPATAAVLTLEPDAIVVGFIDDVGGVDGADELASRDGVLEAAPEPTRTSAQLKNSSGVLPCSTQVGMVGCPPMTPPSPAHPAQTGGYL